MSDLAPLGPTIDQQALTADALAPSAIDPTGLDLRFQALHSAEAASVLPELPDEVRFDLVSSFSDPAAVTSFYRGLESDLDAMGRPEPERAAIDSLYLPQPPTTPGGRAMFASRDDLRSQIRRVIEPIAGAGTLGGPEIISTDAVENFKSKAVADGILGPDTAINSRWDGESLNAYYEANSRLTQQALQGNRPGAISVGRALEIMDDWMSPSGLWRAALAMDLVWDPSAIAEGVEDWDPVGGVKKLWGWLKDPTDTAKISGAFDALLGPVDDIVFPAVNLGLMFVGVGQVVNFARVAKFASSAGKIDKAFDAAKAVDRFGDTFRALGGIPVGNVARVADDVARFTTPSYLAAKIGGRAPAAGRAMETWRSYTAVASAKKAVQKGMQLGLLARVEAEISPDRQGISILGRGTFEEREAKVDNPFTRSVGMALEIPFSPISFWQQGTLRRADDAVGIGAFRRWASDLDNNKAMVIQAEQTVMDILRLDGSAEAKRQLARLEAVRRSGGPRDVVRVALGGETASEEHAGQVLAYLATTAGVNKAADTFARHNLMHAVTEGLDIGETSEYRDMMFLMRGKLISQLRPLDNLDLDTTAGAIEYLRVRSGMESIDDATGAVRGRRQEIFKELRESLFDEATGLLTPEGRARAAREIADHERVRRETYARIMEDLGPEDLDLMLREAWPTLSRWDEWNGYSTTLQDAVKGGLKVRIKPVGARGRRVREPIVDVGSRQQLLQGFLDEGHSVDAASELADEALSSVGRGQRTAGSVEHMSNDYPSTFISELDTELRATFNIPQADISSKRIDQLQQTADNGFGMVTLGRIDDGSPTVQEAMYVRARLNYLLGRKGRLTALGDIDIEPFGASLADYASKLGKDPKALSRVEIRSWARQTVGPLGVTAKQTDDFASGVRWALRFDESPSSALATLNAKLQDLSADSELWARFGVGNMGSLDEKLEALSRKMRYMAAEVEVPGPLGQKLAESGYRAVRGPDFLLRSDLLHYDGPLAHVSKADVARKSLGESLGRIDNAQVASLREQRFRSAIARHMRIAQESSKDGEDLGYFGRTFDADVEGHVNSLLEDLSRIWTEYEGSRGRAAELTEGAGLLNKMTGRVANQTIPLSRYHMDPKYVQSRLTEIGYGKRATKAISAALRDAADVGPQYKGLAHLEDHALANSWIRGALKGFTAQVGATELRGMNGLANAREMHAGLRNGPVGRVYTEMQAWRSWFDNNLAYVSADNTLAARMASGAFAAGVAYNAGEEDGSAALVGALAGFTGGRRLVNLRNAARLGMGAMAYQATPEDMDPMARLAIAGAAGAVGVRALSKPAQLATREGGWLDQAGFARYSRLTDSAIHARNVVRFALSPIFDAQRYTEGAVLGTTALGADVPVTMNYARSAKKWAGKQDSIPHVESWWADMNERYKVAASNAYGITVGKSIDLVDDIQRWSRDRGILGYSPHEQFVGAFSFLTEKAGLDDITAARKVIDGMTYGVRGRAPLEQSVNFIFFPFSFSKKYVGQLGKFLTDDYSRLVVTHDALKVWNDVWAETDMSERWREYVPILGFVRKMNALQFGISPGEFGGINRPFYNLFSQVPVLDGAQAAFMNAFVPQFLRVQTEQDFNSVQRSIGRLIPVWRDATDAFGDVADQFAVAQGLVGPQAAVSGRAGRTRGWQEYRDLRVEAQRQLGSISLASALRSSDPRYVTFQRWYEGQIAGLGAKYPSWEKSRVDAAGSAIQRQQDLAFLVAAPETAGEQSLAAFTAKYERVRQQMRSREWTFDRPEEIPSEIYTYLRNEAIREAAKSPGFVALYDQFYLPTLGPITERI